MDIMREVRGESLSRLKQSLSAQQRDDLRDVIVTADAQGDYLCNQGDDESHWTDDVQSTLACLADEICGVVTLEKEYMAIATSPECVQVSEGDVRFCRLAYRWTESFGSVGGCLQSN